MATLLLALLLAVAAWPARASDVLELSDDDFDSSLADRNVALVEFYAPWWVGTAARRSPGGPLSPPGRSGSGKRGVPPGGVFAAGLALRRLPGRQGAGPRCRGLS